MDNLGILVQAILSLKDTTSSKNQIAKELPKLESQLQSDKNTRVKIVAGLDIAKSKNLIQSQLNTLANQAKAPAIKVGIDTSGLNSVQGATQNITNSLKTVQTQAQQTVNVVANTNANIGNSARTISTQYRTEFGVVTDVVKQAETEFARFGEVSAVSNKSVKALKGVPEHFKDFTIRVKSATGEVQKFFYTFENVGDFKNPVFKYMLQNINEADAGVKRLADDIEKVKAQYTSKLAGFESTNSQIKTGLSAEIAKVNDEINKLGVNNGSIQNLKVAFDNLTASANKIKENLKATGASLNPVDNAINKYKNMDNVLKEITTSFNNLSIKPTGLGDSLNSVKSQLIELQNLEKSEGGYTEAWAKKYRDVSLAVAEVKTNIELALKAEKSDKGSSYQTQLKYLNKIKEETNTIISLKRKMVNAGDEEKALYQHEITKAQKCIQYDVQQLEKKKLLTNEAKYLVNTYKAEIALQDRINNAKLNDKASTQRIADIKSYNAEINKAITKLNSLNNSGTFRNNASNSQVTQTKQDINSLITAYQNLATKLQGNITPAGLETVRTELTQLNARFNDTTTTAKQFETELKNGNGAYQLAQKVALLTARIEAFKKVNSKSVKQFGSNYDSMLSELRNPNIDEATYNRINKQFQIMRQEIVATDKAGKSLFDLFKDKSKKFLGWMSMTFMYSLAMRTIRSMISDVVELDYALVDLKKTFKGTTSELQDFYYESSNIAKQLGVTSKEVITSASSWSRLGYNTKQTAIEMAKAASIMKMISPNMDIETANNGLISIVKAFQEIDTNQIIDQVISPINEVGNTFAVSNSDILEGLQRSSAAMKMMGEDLTSTIALFTAGNEILQDASQMGNALRSISMRVRGKSLPPYCESSMLYYA